MTPQDNKDLIRRTFRAIGRKDLDALAAALSDDVVEHEEFPGMEPNKEGVLRFFGHLTTAFPDLEMRAEAILADGDLVSVRGTLLGTHRGEFLDMPPTGNRIEVPFADFFRIEDGKIAEHWGVTDSQAMMEQLGGGEA